MEEIQDTSGFYKEQNGEWYYAPNFIRSNQFELSRDGDRTTTDGWVWYDVEPTEYTEWVVFNESFKPNFDL